MKLPRIVTLLGYAGMLPFLIGPAWMTFSPGTVPHWLDHAWLAWVAMIASFMSGTFWGFALPACEGPEGTIGLVVAALLVMVAWVAVALPLHLALAALVVVFLLQLLADFWRERTLGSIEGYFRLRAVLTCGACVGLAWRLMLAS